MGIISALIVKSRDGMMWILVIIFVILQISSGFGLECYVCDDYRDDKCGDPIATTGAYVNDCGAAQSQMQYTSPVGQVLRQEYRVTPPLCYKAVAIKYSKKTTYRGCSYYMKDTCDVLETAIVADGGTMDFCETCDENACNVAAKTSSSLLSLLTTAIAMFIARR